MITNYFKTLSCRRIAPLLFARSQNAELSPEDEAKLSAHVAHCAACQIEAAQFARIALDLRQATPAAPLPSPDLWSRIQAEITTDTAQKSPVPQRPIARTNPFAPRLGGFAWAGSAAIVFVGGAWMAYGAGFWGHNGTTQSQLPAASGPASSGPANVTLIPPVPAASDTAVMAKATAKKASGGAMASIAKPTASPVRSSVESRPDPFVPVSVAPPTKPAVSDTLANRTQIAPAQQTKATTLGALARLQNRDAREAATRGVNNHYAATTSRSLTFDTAGSATLGVTPLPDAFHSASAKTVPPIADAVSGTTATVAPNLPEGEPATTTIAAALPPAPVTASMANAAPLGVSAAFAYSSVKSLIDSDSPALDDAEPRSIPTAGSGGAFSVGEPTSRMRRQRALFSYGRP